MYCKYSDGSLIQLVKARYARTDPQELTTYHVPLTDINGAIPLGLNWQTWTISGVIADSMSVRWRDIIWLSLDNVSWRACRVQATAFPTNNYQQSLYELTVLVSPTLEGPIVRYPTSGYKWGNQSITGVSQAGNVNAYPIIHYLAPLFYAPLSNTLIDFAGNSVTFTRTAAKDHAGVTYGINVPIFDSGLSLASDTAQDVALWTPPASTLRTIAMQIKHTTPLTNLVANGEFEVNTTGWTGSNATLSQETGAPLVGTGSLKSILTANGGYTYVSVTCVVGHVYHMSAVVKSTAAAGRLTRLQVVTGGAVQGASIDASTRATATLTFTATATTALPFVAFVSGITGEIIYADSVVCYDLTALFGGTILTVWTAAQNKLTIDMANNLVKWTDDTTTVQTTFPTVEYLAGTVIDIVVEEDTAHAVTVAVHAAGGLWAAGVNLVANGEFETGVIGWTGSNTTLSQEMGSPLVGTGSLKILYTANGGFTYCAITTIIGHTYVATCRAKSTAAAGRLSKLRAAGTFAVDGASVNCSAQATLSVTFVATATTTSISAWLDAGLTNESLLVDSVVCYDLSANTLAAIAWPQLTLGNLEGSIANLVQYPYVLTSAEYQALAYSSLSLLFNALYLGNRYAGEVVKGSDKRLLNALGSDISSLLGGVDIPIGASAVTIAQSQGLSARWYVEVKRTDV